jgi:hypothetical protein
MGMGRFFAVRSFVLLFVPVSVRPIAPAELRRVRAADVGRYF